MYQFSILETNLGKIGLVSHKDKLNQVILPNKLKLVSVKPTRPSLYSLFMIKCRNQFEQYFNGSLKNFKIDISFQITKFYKKTLLEVGKIKYGDTSSYKMIAKKIKHPKSYRAIGNALAANPLPIIIPCHRVILTNNRLGNFGGGKKLKYNLLKLENRNEF